MRCPRTRCHAHVAYSSADSSRKVHQIHRKATLLCCTNRTSCCHVLRRALSCAPIDAWKWLVSTNNKYLITILAFKLQFQIVKYLPNSPNIICGTIDRDCHRERAYLFVQNCNATWVNTNLSAGREYCCKDGTSFKCPMLI